MTQGKVIIDVLRPNLNTLASCSHFSDANLAAPATVKNSAENASSWQYASFASPPQQKPTFNPDFQLKKFHLQSVARFILSQNDNPKHKRWRTCDCLRSQHKGQTSVNYVQRVQRAHYGGLVTCGSVWVCPVCSVKVSAKRSQDLLDSIPNSGLTPILVTYTLQHTIDDSLSRLWADLRAAYRRVFNGAPYQRLRDRFQIAGYVSAKETRFSLGSGWHPHIHQMFLSKLPPEQIDAELLREKILSRYGAVLSAAGYLVNQHTVHVDVRATRFGGAVEKYLAKWSVELTGQYLKEGDSLSPFQLLSEFDSTGDIWLSERFREYADVTYASKQLIWSRGLLALLKIAEKSDEEIANAMDEEAFLLAVLDRDEWRRVLDKKLRGELLNVASTGNPQTLYNWLVQKEIINEIS